MTEPMSQQCRDGEHEPAQGEKCAPGGWGCACPCHEAPVPHLPEIRNLIDGRFSVCRTCTREQARIVEWPCTQPDPQALAAYNLTLDN